MRLSRNRWITSSPIQRWSYILKKWSLKVWSTTLQTNHYFVDLTSPPLPTNQVGVGVWERELGWKAKSDLKGIVMVLVLSHKLWQASHCLPNLTFHFFFGQLCTIPLINMIKADKRITGHITKHVHPVKIQSYADDTTIIINQQNEIKYIYEIFNKHSRASEVAINMEKHKYSDLVIDMFRQNQSMTISPKRLKTRLLSWG